MMDVAINADHAFMAACDPCGHCDLHPTVQSAEMRIRPLDVMVERYEKKNEKLEARESSEGDKGIAEAKNGLKQAVV